MNKLKLLGLFLSVTFFCYLIAGPKNILTVSKQPIAEISHTEKAEIVSATQTYKRMVEPVVVIYTLRGERPISTGTAFSVAYDKKEDKTYFLTNNHICSTSDFGTIMVGEQANNDQAHFTYDGNPDMKFELIDTSPDDDLCLLRTDGYFKPVKINKKNVELRQAEKLYLVGAPNSNFPIILETYFSGYLHRSFLRIISKEGHDALMISEIVQPGHSGSPIYNEKGELVGIVFASSVRENLAPGVSLFSYGGLGISLHDILEFLEKNGIE